MTHQRLSKVLVVDDNVAIHSDFKKIFTRVAPTYHLDELERLTLGNAPALSNNPLNGYQLESVFQGQQALERVEAAKRANDRFGLAFVDRRMPPGWDGLETIGHLWVADPGTSGGVLFRIFRLRLATKC